MFPFYPQKTHVFFIACVAVALASIFIRGQGLAQKKNNKIDSLLSLSAKLKDSPQKVEVLRNLAWEYRNNNFKEGLFLSKQAIDLAIALQYGEGLAKSYNTQGVIYRNIGDYDKALECFFKALKVAENIKNIEQIAYSNNNLGDIYKNKKDYKKAINYIQKAILLFEQIKDKRGLAYGYIRLGDTYNSQKMYNKALEYYEKCLSIRLELNEKDGYASILNRIGVNYQNRKDYVRALEYFYKSAKIDSAINNQKGISANVTEIARTYLLMGQYDKALDIAKKSLEASQKIKNFEQARTSAEIICQVYLKRQNYKEAFEYQVIHEIMEDSLSLENLDKQAAKLEADYELEKRQSQLDILERDKIIKKQTERVQSIILGVSILGFTAFSVLAIFLYRSYRKQKVTNIHLKQIQEELRLATEILEQDKRQIMRQKEILEQNREVLIKLTRNNAVQSGNWHIALQIIAKTTAETLDVQQVGIWLYENKPKEHLDCANIYDREKRTHSEEGRLDIEGFEEYFHQIKKGEIIVAENVATHPILQILNKTYYEPNNIKSSLVIPFFSKSGFAGVVTIEAKHQTKAWAEEEIFFAKSISDVLTIAHKAYHRKLAEEQILIQNEIIQEEHEKSERLLLNILPEETAKELKATGKATPKSYEKVTVMFTDFKGFTQVVEKLTPQEVIQELEYCFNKFDEIIEKYNLERIKTIGDSYMAAGGVPVPDDDNPINAVKAGLEIQEFMECYKEERISLGLPYFEARLGMHTGEVIAGVVGQKKFAFDIWGDTVNLASRMESSGEVGKVNISEATYRYVKDYFEVEYRGKIKAKNKGEVNMYFVKGEKTLT
ncbi:MAG: tetratricopeptide repeat protein [Microscillaceae bacterium]|nr:tetratricopeptide repeat protein [Microscillaceae bacterium]MDW8461234.1 adenylate/guanylate cyclase domain-containing protein [Cytophagales bacterium]